MPNHGYDIKGIRLGPARDAYLSLLLIRAPNVRA